jgi:alkylation response protein AidB-like acyl-CoA dehydrogenase
MMFLPGSERDLNLMTERHMRQVSDLSGVPEAHMRALWSSDDLRASGSSGLVLLLGMRALRVRHGRPEYADLRRRGYIRENVAERFYRELRVERIWEGTSEIQRNIVADQLAERGARMLSG